MTGSIIWSGGSAPVIGEADLTHKGFDNADLLPGVSFAVPVYNKAAHLPRVLAQIKAQTGDFPREYIFVDDGSTDESLEIVRRETSGWENTVIETQRNKGSAGATNKAVSLARRSFIKFVDADDLLTENATERLLQSLDGSDACLAYGRVQRFRDASEVDLSGPAEGTAVTEMAEPLLPAIKNSLFNPSQFIARTEAIRSVGGCDERVVHSQEYGLTLRLARQWPFRVLDGVVAWLPEDAPGRLSTNEGRQLQRVTRAVAYFLEDYPDLPSSVKRFACRRLAGRAFKYAKRRGGEKPFGRWFWINLLAQLGLTGDAAVFARRCVEAFGSAEQAAVGELAPNYQN